MWKSKLPKGFSLMEIMVVIGIMAVVSAAAMSVMGPSSRQGARDTRRRADLETIASALAMYRNDNGQYPPCDAGGSAQCTTGYISSTYLGTLPIDPISSTGRDYIYSPRYDFATSVTCNGTTSRCRQYTLCASSEKLNTSAVYCPAVCGSLGDNCSLIVSQL